MPSSAWYRINRDLHSFPTRRSSDLKVLSSPRRIRAAWAASSRRSARWPRPASTAPPPRGGSGEGGQHLLGGVGHAEGVGVDRAGGRDRKSTRLNSSHSQISYAVFCLVPHQPRSTLFPYTTLFRSESSLISQADSSGLGGVVEAIREVAEASLDGPAAAWRLRRGRPAPAGRCWPCRGRWGGPGWRERSEEHTSELQSQSNLVCRLLLGTASTEIYTLSLHDALPI